MATVSAQDNDVGGEGTKAARLKRNRDLEAVVGKSGGGIRRACQVVGYDTVTELLVFLYKRIKFHGAMTADRPSDAAAIGTGAPIAIVGTYGTSLSSVISGLKSDAKYLLGSRTAKV